MASRSQHQHRDQAWFESPLTISGLRSGLAKVRNNYLVTFRPGPHLADRADIVSWARRYDARTNLPRLVRGLIRANNDQVTELQMRAAEGVDVPGYDGTSYALRSTPFVPEGAAVWEMGVSGDPGDKAQRDYRTRTDNPLGITISETTFVFVTPHEWREKDAWVQKKRAEGKWLDVRALDVDDIEQALELAPAVHLWFSELTGKPAHGAMSIDSWWERFRRLSSPALDPEMVLAGRADDAAQLLRTFAGSPRLTSIAAVNTDEVIAFVAATIFSAEPAIQQDLLDRTLVVRDSHTLELLHHHEGLLILIPYEDDLRRDALLVPGHHVVIRADDGSNPSIDLPPIDTTEFQAQLERRDVPRERARAHAQLARRSLEAFQRGAPAPGAERAPAWASNLVGRVARRAWLVGKWDERRSGDQDALAALLGLDYEAAREDLLVLAQGADPLLIVVGERWAVSSAEDAWRYGQPQLQPPDLEAFEVVIQDVLGAVDPRLELPVEERWLAAVRGKVQVHSSDLRDGVAGMLALLGSRADQVRVGSGTVGSWLRRTIWQLFERANSDMSGHLWASLTDVMPLLAEAVPDVFLGAVQQGLEGDRPLLGLMFADDRGQQSFTVSSPHTGLLWALEVVAWSPDHFPLAVEQLARLAEVDPGGRLSNRPAASLSDIYRSWLPQTTVALNRRLTVLDGLRRRHPTVSWPLLLTMLPETNAIGQHSHAPRYRTWKPAESDTINPDVRESFEAAGLRLVADAAVDPDRWAELADRFGDLPPSSFDAAVDALERLGVDRDGLAVRAAVWAPIHALVMRHRRFADAAWAIPSQQLDRLDTLQRSLAPEDVEGQIEWLFDEDMPDLPIEEHAGFEVDNYMNEVRERRRDAITQLIAHDGLPGVLSLATGVRYPWLVGGAIADAHADDIGRALLDFIDSEDEPTVEAARAWAARAAVEDGSWLTSVVSGFAGRPLAQARLLLASDDVESAWAVADKDRAISDAYWSEFRPYGHGPDFPLVNEAGRRLLANGRPLAALTLMSLYARDGKADADLVVEGLEAVVGLAADHAEQYRLEGFGLARLLEVARKSDAPRARIAQLEWAFGPVLGYESGSPVLQEQLATEPSLFIQVLSMVFKPRHSEVGNGVADNVAHNAYRLLDGWTVLPGSFGHAGTIDSAGLDKWIDEALRQAADVDRLEVALEQIGKILAKSTPDSDGSWPPAPVRNAIERISRTELDDGFRVQIFNSRGVQARDLEEGGEREQALATRFRNLADRVSDESPRTAAILRSVADGYAAEARRYDDRVQRLAEGLDP